MKLASMRKESEEGGLSSPENYGYGLCLYLSDEDCEAMGLTKALKAGTQVTISAKAVVVSSTESLDTDADGGGNEVSMRLQITDMGMQANGVMRNAAAMLYGGKGE